MGDEIENGRKLQKKNIFVLLKKLEDKSGWQLKIEQQIRFIKKIWGYICHFILLDQKSTPRTTYLNFLDKRPQLSLGTR